MQPSLESKSVVPGASRATNDQGVPYTDPKGRPVWNKAEPAKHVTHFHSAGHRRMYEAGEITLNEATHKVPVYRSLSNAAAKAVRTTIKQRKKAEERNRQKGAVDRLGTAAGRAREGLQNLGKAAAESGLGAVDRATTGPRDPADLTPEQAVAFIDEHGSIMQAAKMTGYSRDALRRRRDIHRKRVEAKAA